MSYSCCLATNSKQLSLGLLNVLLFALCFIQPTLVFQRATSQPQPQPQPQLQPQLQQPFDLDAPIISEILDFPPNDTVIVIVDASSQPLLIVHYYCVNLTAIQPHCPCQEQNQLRCSSVSNVEFTNFSAEAGVLYNATAQLQYNNDTVSPLSTPVSFTIAARPNWSPDSPSVVPGLAFNGHLVVSLLLLCLCLVGSVYGANVLWQRRRNERRRRELEEYQELLNNEQ